MNKFKRILLKISGEALACQSSAIDFKKLEFIATEFKSLPETQIALVVGGGNFLRGTSLLKYQIPRTTADFAGMCATVINAFILKDTLINSGFKAAVMGSFFIPGKIQVFNPEKANDYLNNNYILIFAGGTGSPYFTTDTAAALRALEIKADVLLKATKVDGVYDKDPEKFKNAVKFSKISYDEVLRRQLKVMDLTAISMCRENRLPLVVFKLFKKGNLYKTLTGKTNGTIIY